MKNETNIATRWFTSDTHFGHANIIRLGAGRDFATVDAMNQKLIENAHRVVGPK